MDKYCRICWNTSKWEQPTGEARRYEIGASYVAETGFGHEEWLFNCKWLLSGYEPADTHYYRYGFLQPINKYRHTYEGLTFSVLLYTVSPSGSRMIVAQIDDLFVPYEDELGWVLSRTVENGWLNTMRQQLGRLDISSAPLDNPSPLAIANVRFRPEKVVFYDPMLTVDDGHKITRIHWYQPLDWDDGFTPAASTPVKTEPPDRPEDSSPERSEAERIRAAQKETEYDPRHVRLQNQLYRALCARYGWARVLYEMGFVDLTLLEDKGRTFIEIKTRLTVKECMRSALGQLIEYAHYPNADKADTLLVVGEAIPTAEDIVYLRHIRGKYALPIRYAQWSWPERQLRDRI